MSWDRLERWVWAALRHGFALGGWLLVAWAFAMHTLQPSPLLLEPCPSPPPTTLRSTPTPR